jgi:hypothetical protein
VDYQRRVGKKYFSFLAVYVTIRHPEFSGLILLFGFGFNPVTDFSGRVLLWLT